MVVGSVVRVLGILGGCVRTICDIFYSQGKSRLGDRATYGADWGDDAAGGGA